MYNFAFKIYEYTIILNISSKNNLLDGFHLSYVVKISNITKA